MSFVLRLALTLGLSMGFAFADGPLVGGAKKTEKAAKATGDAVKDGANATVEGTKKAAETTGKTLKKGADATVEGTGKALESTGKGLTGLGKRLSRKS
jgi:hypothetical protein